MVATARARVADRPLTLRWTPSTLEISVFIQCTFTASRPTQIWIESRLNGHGFVGRTCTPDGVQGLASHARIGDGDDTAIGRASTFTVTAIKAIDAQTGHEVPMPPDAAIAIAIGEAMDFDAYPLPPRPSVLPPLKQSDIRTDVVADPQELAPLRRSDPADPLQPLNQTIVWTGGLDVRMMSATPGYLQMTVDGVEILLCRYWTYQASECFSLMWPMSGALVMTVGVAWLPERATADTEDFAATSPPRSPSQHRADALIYFGQTAMPFPALDHELPSNTS